MSCSWEPRLLPAPSHLAELKAQWISFPTFYCSSTTYPPPIQNPSSMKPAPANPCSVKAWVTHGHSKPIWTCLPWPVMSGCDAQTYRFSPHNNTWCIMMWLAGRQKTMAFCGHKGFKRDSIFDTSKPTFWSKNENIREDLKRQRIDDNNEKKQKWSSWHYFPSSYPFSHHVPTILIPKIPNHFPVIRWHY